MDQHHHQNQHHQTNNQNHLLQNNQSNSINSNDFFSQFNNQQQDVVVVAGVPSIQTSNCNQQPHSITSSQNHHINHLNLNLDQSLFTSSEKKKKTR